MGNKKYVKAADLNLTGEKKQKLRTRATEVSNARNETEIMKKLYEN